MHRNTVFFIGFLAVLAAVLVGINIGRRIPQVSPTLIPPSPISSPASLQPVVSLSNQADSRLEICGLSFSYEPGFTLKQSSNAAELAGSNETIRVVCTAEIPRPPLPPEKMEEITLDGVKTTLYHDASAKDGTPLDAVIFKHPKKDLDVGIFGFGGGFKKLVQTIKFN